MLQHMGPWDWAIYAVAGYVAVTALVRLMLNRRNAVVAEVRSQLTIQKKKPSNPPSHSSNGPPTSKAPE